MKKRRAVLVGLAVVSALMGLVLSACKEKEPERIKPGDIVDNIKYIDVPDEDVCGGRTTYQYMDCKDEITSDVILTFSYIGADFSVASELAENGKLHIESAGGNIYERDGSQFMLDYEAEDAGFMKELNTLIKEFGMSENNGLVSEVGGLPPGCGDTLSVTYDGGERIYKSSNQSATISPEAADAIYQAFEKKAEENGYAFSTEGSTEQLYDDADEEFLQGVWSGKHFGAEVVAEFEGNHVVITRDGEVTDDTDYVIIEGVVHPDILRDKPIGSREEDKYEQFAGVTSLSKYNDFTLHAYVYDGSSSSFNMLKQD